MPLPPALPSAGPRTNVAESAPGAREGLSSVTRGTLVMMVGTLGFVAESFVSRVILIRTLSLAQWGQFSLALALAGLLTTLGSLGVTQAVARLLPFATNDAERRRVVRTAFLLLVPAAAAVSALLAVLSVPIGSRSGAPGLALTLEFFSVSVGLTIVGSLIAAIFQGYEDVLPNALFLQVLNPILFIVFLLVAEGITPLRLAYPVALTGYVLSSLLTLGGLLLYLRARLPRLLPSGPSEPGISPTLVRFALPLLGFSLLGFLTGSGDTLVLGALDRGAVGLYTADLSLARLLQVGVGSLAYIILPVTARLVRRGDTPSIRVTYATATKWIALTSLPLFLLFFFLPSPSLAFVYGSPYAASTVALRLLVLGSLLGTLVGPATAAQVSFGETKLLLINTLASACVDLGLSFLLVPLFGITGAAVAWAVSNALYPILSMAELASLHGVHPFRRPYVVPLVATALPLGGALLLLPVAPPLWALPGLGVAFAAAFGAVVLATGSVDAGDELLLEAIEGILGRRLNWVRRLGRLRIHRLRSR